MARRTSWIGDLAFCFVAICLTLAIAGIYVLQSPPGDDFPWRGLPLLRSVLVPAAALKTSNTQSPATCSTDTSEWHQVSHTNGSSGERAGQSATTPRMILSPMSTLAPTPG